MKLFKKIKQRISEQNKSDEGADVLVVGIILFPIVAAAMGFSLDISKNIYLSNSYTAMAQEAAYEASQNRNIYGELTANSGRSFVREYNIQRGDTVIEMNNVRGEVGNNTRETAAFRSGCQTSMTRGDLGLGGNPDHSVNLPYIELRYVTDRGGSNWSEATYASSGGTVPSMAGYHPRDRYVVNATVYETGNNFLLGIFGNDCQVYSSEVSSIAVTSDGQDYQNQS